MDLNNLKIVWATSALHRAASWRALRAAYVCRDQAMVAPTGSWLGRTPAPSSAWMPPMPPPPTPAPLTPPPLKKLANRRCGAFFPHLSSFESIHTWSCLSFPVTSCPNLVAGVAPTSPGFWFPPPPLLPSRCEMPTRLSVSNQVRPHPSPFSICHRSLPPTAAWASPLKSVVVPPLLHNHTSSHLLGAPCNPLLSPAPSLETPDAQASQLASSELPRVAALPRQLQARWPCCACTPCALLYGPAWPVSAHGLGQGVRAEWVTIPWGQWPWARLRSSTVYGLYFLN
jgi:hypothetical protein